jgi:hypothetical protein
VYSSLESKNKQIRYYFLLQTKTSAITYIGSIVSKNIPPQQSDPSYIPASKSDYSPAEYQNIFTTKPFFTVKDIK